MKNTAFSLSSQPYERLNVWVTESAKNSSQQINITVNTERFCFKLSILCTTPHISTYCVFIFIQIQQNNLVFSKAIPFQSLKKNQKSWFPCFSLHCPCNGSGWETSWWYQMQASKLLNSCCMVINRMPKVFTALKHNVF